MGAAIFSYKGLAVGWAGLLGVVGSGALALQLSMPPPQPPLAVASTGPIPVAPAPAFEVPPPAPMTIAVPVAPAVPFENRSLLAMLPPPSWHPTPHVAAILPLPPLPPPVRHAARPGPRREVRVYAAVPAPAYEPTDWGQVRPYPGMYARGGPYPYGGPRTYYGW